MTAVGRAELALLLLVTAALAVGELLYLPLYLGTVPFPVTVLVAAATMPWLIRSAGTLHDRGLVVASPLLVWLLVIFVFGLLGPGGDAVLVPDWRTLLLLAAGALPAAIVLGGTLAAQVQRQSGGSRG